MEGCNATIRARGEQRFAEALRRVYGRQTSALGIARFKVAVHQKRGQGSRGQGSGKMRGSQISSSAELHI